MSAITGIVKAGGRPAGGALVVAAEHGAREVLASARAGEGGEFRLDLPAGAGGPVGVLARVDGPALGVAGVIAAPGEQLALDLTDHGPLHPLTVIAAGDVPPELELQLTPRHVAGLDDDLLALMYAAVGGMTRTMLAVRPLRDPVNVAAQEGRWLLYAAYEAGADALGMDPVDASWEVERATTPAGEELTRGIVGHEIDVAGPTTVTLHVVRRGG